VHKDGYSNTNLEKLHYGLEEGDSLYPEDRYSILTIRKSQRTSAPVGLPGGMQEVSRVLQSIEELVSHRTSSHLPHAGTMGCPLVGPELFVLSVDINPVL